MLEVRRRGGFSDRNGIKPENTEIQMESLDDRTRAALIGVFTKNYSLFFQEARYDREETQTFCRFVRGEIFALPVDFCEEYRPEGSVRAISDVITNGKIDDVLTVVEAVVEFLDYYGETHFYDIRIQAEKDFNDAFEREYVGYRIINKQITPISDRSEVSAIKEASCSSSGLVREHLDKALGFLSDRSNPDYENSIKESITAVEAMCEEITGIRGKDATLGAMLKKLEEKGIVIHSALKSAFDKLYGYTNDANGIRHAGDIGGPNSTFEEAKFMLVSCCAFINYLIAVQAKQ